MAFSNRNSSSAGQPKGVALHISTGGYFIDNHALAEIAQRLRGTLHRRTHWIKVDALRQEVGEKSHKLLKEMLGFEHLDPRWESLSQAGIIEVSIDASLPRLRDAQQFPWEFLLSSATESRRSGSALVIRHLKGVKNKVVHAAPHAIPKKADDLSLLVVKSLPGFLNEYYSTESLDTEQANVEANLGIRSKPIPLNPTLLELKQAVIKNRPRIIHLAGVDAIQGKQILNPNGQAAASLPGMMLQDSRGKPRAEPAESLAEALCAAREKPALVSFNFLNSATLGAEAVARGAEAALCFQGEIDDLLAEMFFFNFYLAWRLSDGRVLDAFRLAWHKLAEKQRTELYGTGIVLWSSDSLLDREEQYRKQQHISAPLDQPPLRLQERFNRRMSLPVRLTKNRPPVVLDVRPSKALNYSILHNNRSPFDWFAIYKEEPIGKFDDLSIEVVLYNGEERTSYHAFGAMDSYFWPVHDEVRLPLTSVLARSVRESIYTSMVVRVRHKQTLFYEKTHRVKLLPIDQWQDDDENRQWLPSFVLPRDPAVPRIIDCAQKYVSLLADDHDAGFEGYQKSAEEVDQRVRGIWWTLIHDMPVNYIAPPPVFVSSAQRLRSPSEILAARRGTCLDLALLLASCLESVDLYPVIFLLEGHAFTGYYRSHKAYLRVRDWTIQESMSSNPLWLMGREFYETLLQLVQEGELAPLETVCLTQRRGFWEAVEEGGVNLRSKSSFQFMVDIKLARECDVTPLPL